MAKKYARGARDLQAPGVLEEVRRATTTGGRRDRECLRGPWHSLRPRSARPASCLRRHHGSNPNRPISARLSSASPHHRRHDGNFEEFRTLIDAAGRSCSCAHRRVFPPTGARRARLYRSGGRPQVGIAGPSKLGRSLVSPTRRPSTKKPKTSHVRRGRAGRGPALLRPAQPIELRLDRLLVGRQARRPRRRASFAES